MMSVDEVLEADRPYFLAHPDEEELIREFCPGEFGAAELPEIVHRAGRLGRHGITLSGEQTAAADLMATHEDDLLQA